MRLQLAAEDSNKGPLTIHNDESPQVLNGVNVRYPECVWTVSLKIKGSLPVRPLVPGGTTGEIEREGINNRKEQ